MAMLAAPQPSFSCFTKGTSSQTPGRSAASSIPHTPSNIRIVLTGVVQWLPPAIAEALSNSDNNQNKRGDRHDNDDQIPIAECARGEIGLGVVHPRRQLCQFGVVQRRDGGLHLLRVHVRSLQRLLGLLRRKE